MTGAAIKKAREKVGLTQQELADSLNVSKSSICGWEADTFKPKPKQWPALAEALDVDEMRFLPGRVLKGSGGRAVHSDDEMVDLVGSLLPAEMELAKGLLRAIVAARPEETP